MKIIKEDAPQLCLPKEFPLSFLYENKSCWYALMEKGEALFSFKEGGYNKISLKHCFTKLMFIEKSGEYIALYHHTDKPKSGLYILDLYLNETDFIPFTVNSKSFFAIDVAISTEKNCILALSQNKLLAFNTNADCLGTIICAPKGRCYKAFCTYGSLMLIAYEYLSCLYVAAYDLNGCFIEKISIGSEYILKNMQLVRDGDSNILQLFLYKNNKFPTLIKISLQNEASCCKNKGNFSIAEICAEVIPPSCNLPNNPPRHPDNSDTCPKVVNALECKKNIIF